MVGKTIKLDIGTIYQKTPKGCYYFRYQINGQRKAVSLKTKNQKEAILKAEDLMPVVKATSTEVISAHVKHARGMAKKKKPLPLAMAWEVYSKHPERATPATVNEQLAYEATFKELIEYIGEDIQEIGQITSDIANDFAEYLRTQNIAVDTHNRKIKRLKRIFDALKEYSEIENPFVAKSLRRKEREEQDNIVRRISFTREQEKQLLEELKSEKRKLKNKDEIRVIYHLGMFTGQRLKDCVLLRWEKVDLNRRRIWVKQFKTGAEVTIPIAPELFDTLQEAKGWKIDEYVCPNVARRYKQVNIKGKDIGSNLVGVDVLRVIRWIGLEPSVKVPGRKRKVTVYGFHSLRHSFASHCAEAGVPKAVVLSILGANSDVVDKHYTHIGEEAQEKAIMAISGKFATKTAQDRIDEAIKFINELPEKDIVPAIEHIVRVLKG